MMHTRQLVNYTKAAMYKGNVIIPSSLTPIFPSINLYPYSISSLFFIKDLREVARVLPLLPLSEQLFPLSG